MRRLASDLKCHSIPALVLYDFVNITLTMARCLSRHQMMTVMAPCGGPTGVSAHPTGIGRLCTKVPFGHFVCNYHSKHRMGNGNVWVIPKPHRAPYTINRIINKYIFYLFIINKLEHVIIDCSWQRTGAVKLYSICLNRHRTACVDHLCPKHKCDVRCSGKRVCTPTIIDRTKAVIQHYQGIF